MKLYALAAAAAALVLGSAAAAPAEAQMRNDRTVVRTTRVVGNGDRVRERTVVRVRTDNGRHDGWRNNRRRQVCRTVWRHHHRDRVCTWRRW